MEQSNFDELYKNYKAAIFFVICKYIKNHEVAKDVLQIVFFKISRHIARYDDSKGVLYTWMKKIAVNTALDVLKSSEYKRLSKCISLDDPELDLLNFTYEVTQSETIGLDNLLKILPENQRAIVDLLYLQEYSHLETSVYLSISLGTVKSQLKIALDKMRKHGALDLTYYNTKPANSITNKGEARV